MSCSVKYIEKTVGFLYYYTLVILQTISDSLLIKLKRIREHAI